MENRTEKSRRHKQTGSVALPPASTNNLEFTVYTSKYADTMDHNELARFAATRAPSSKLALAVRFRPHQ